MELTVPEFVTLLSVLVDVVVIAPPAPLGVADVLAIVPELLMLLPEPIEKTVVFGLVVSVIVPRLFRVCVRPGNRIGRLGACSQQRARLHRAGCASPTQVLRICAGARLDVATAACTRGESGTAGAREQPGEQGTDRG